MKKTITKIVAIVSIIISLLAISLVSEKRLGATVLFPYQGGTGKDTSGWTGLIRVDSGVWSTTTESDPTLSTWTGSENIDTVGTIATGTWNATKIDISDYTNLSAGRSLTMSGDAVDADAELYTEVKSIVVESPTADDDALVQIEFPTAITITQITCSVATDTASTTIQFDERAESTPNTAGTDVMTSALICDSDSASTTSFANAGISANSILSLDVDAVSGTPEVLRIHIYYTKDD